MQAVFRALQIPDVHGCTSATELEHLYSHQC